MQTSLAPRDFPRDLTAAVMAGAAVTLALGVVIRSYFEGAFLAALSYFSDERPTADLMESLGAPPREVTLFGIHVFADYLIPHYWVGLENPWLQDQTGAGGEAAVNYLPSALVPFQLLSVLPYRLGLMVFLLLMAAALMAPAWYAFRGRAWSERILGMVILGIATGPAIASLDRGNTQGFVPLLVFCFAVAVLRERWSWATVFLILAASLKVYPLVLVLVLIALRKWRWAIASVVGTVVLAAVSLPLVSANLWPTAWNVLEDLAGFGDKGYEQYLTYNVSVAGGLAHAANVVGLDGMSQWIAGHGLLVGAAYLAVVAPLIWMSRLDLWLRLITAMMLMTGVLPNVYPYSAGWVIAAMALAVLMSVGSRGADGRDGPTLAKRVWVPLLVSLALIAMPWPLFVPGSSEAGYPASMLSIALLAASVILPAALWLAVVAGHRDRAAARAA